MRLARVPVASPSPLPPFELPAAFDGCLALVLWIQLAWLHIMPSALVCKWDVKARREFALAAPAGQVTRVSAGAGVGDGLRGEHAASEAGQSGGRGTLSSIAEAEVSLLLWRAAEPCCCS